MGWVAPVAGVASAALSISAAQQASANGKFNKQVQERNAELKLQEVEAIQSKKELDLAKFDERFKQFQGETITKISTSGAELSGSGLRILRRNAEQAELEKEMIDYNAEIGKSRAYEEANFARIKGDIAQQQARSAAIGYYSQAGQSLLTTFG
jgi:hypothetical protein